MAIAAVKLPCGNVVDSIDIFACGAILHVLRKRMNIDSIKLFCFINQPFYKGLKKLKLRNSVEAMSMKFQVYTIRIHG